MYQVHTSAYVSLLAPGKTDYNAACHSRKTTTYILHVVPITTHTHVRRKSIEKRNKEKIKRERKGKKRKEKTSKRGKTKKERKGKKIQEKQRTDKTRRGSKERKREKNAKLAYPTNSLKTALGS